MPDGTPKYNHPEILARRLQGETWDQIHEDYPGTRLQTLRSSHSQWKKRQRENGREALLDGLHTEQVRQSLSDEDGRNEFNDLTTFTKALTGKELAGLQILEGYGLTESAPVATINPIFGPNKPGSAGLPTLVYQ